MKKLNIPSMPIGKIHSTIQLALNDSGLNVVLAEEISVDIMRALVDEFAGQLFYVPSPERAAQMAIRDRKIWEDHAAGKDVNQLSTDYKLGAVQIVKIVRTQQRLDDDAKQPDLFTES